MPGKDALNCKFRWLKLTKTPIQDQPWTVVENQHLQELVKYNSKYICYFEILNFVDQRATFRVSIFNFF